MGWLDHYVRPKEAVRRSEMIPMAVSQLVWEIYALNRSLENLIGKILLFKSKRRPSG